jgi:lambda repressor-like predicted transcriptional regulator
VEVKRHRRLRRLVPDAELVRRRAAGETLRALAADYGVAHTTLGRYFARAEAVRQLREAGQSLRAERRAAPTRRVAERRAERAIRRQAKEQAPLRADQRSRNDELAARAVEAGGGVEAVIEATGLRMRENVLRAIDPAVLVRAFDNDAANAPAPPDRARLRRLVPDPELMRRRAAGETLRRLASDYGVAHTTLGRWFARPEVARQLHEP